jgi:hypothetical protein
VKTLTRQLKLARLGWLPDGLAHPVVLLLRTVKRESLSPQNEAFRTATEHLKNIAFDAEFGDRSLAVTDTCTVAGM